MLVLLRITMEPGASIDAHGHPGAVTLHVESGVFGTGFVEGSGIVTRAADAGTPAPTEETAPGCDVGRVAFIEVPHFESGASSLEQFTGSP